MIGVTGLTDSDFVQYKYNPQHIDDQPNWTAKIWKDFYNV